MKNFIQEGKSLTLVAPYALTSGQGALIGSLFGVANGAAANGAEVVLSLSGTIGRSGPGTPPVMVVIGVDLPVLLKPTCGAR